MCGNDPLKEATYPAGFEYGVDTNSQSLFHVPPRGRHDDQRSGRDISLMKSREYVFPTLLTMIQFGFSARLERRGTRA